MKNQLKIAITGGIGSGKSQVLAYLQEKGFPIFSCDTINAELLNDNNYLKKLKNLFPNCFLGEVFDKKLLADEIFSSKEKKKRLENLAHPAIMEKLLQRANDCQTTCFCEVPLLLEENLTQYFDKIFVVIRNMDDRIASIINRDGCDKSIAIKKIENQFPYDKGLKEGFFQDEKFILLFNDSTIENLKNQIDHILSLINLL